MLETFVISVQPTSESRAFYRDSVWEERIVLSKNLFRGFATKDLRKFADIAFRRSTEERRDSSVGDKVLFCCDWVPEEHRRLSRGRELNSIKLFLISPLNSRSYHTHKVCSIVIRYRKVCSVNKLISCQIRHNISTPSPLETKNLSSPSVSVGDPLSIVNFSVDSRQKHAGLTNWFGFETAF